MSGGEIVVAPAVLVLAPVAAAAVIVVGAGVAAALAVRAAGAGTAAAGRALEHFGDAVEKAADAQDDLEMRSRLWDLAAGAVAHSNHELRLLAARAARAGVRYSLPSPFDLTAKTLADTRAWVARVQEELATARAAVERAESAYEQQTIMGRLPVPADGTLTKSDLLARYQGVLSRRRSTVSPPPVEHRVVEEPARVDRESVQARIDEILGRLDIYATAAERQDAILAAARTVKQTDPGSSRTYLEALAQLVDERINAMVARRREAAHLLVALEHPVIAEAIADASPRPPFLNSVDHLRAVVAGEADLTDADRRAAQDTMAWADKVVERRRLLDAMTEAFAGLGYAVTTGFQVHHSASLSVTQPGWESEHSADVWVDESGNVRWRLVELAEGATAESSRCAELNNAVAAVGAELNGRGFATVVEGTVRPALRRHVGPPVQRESPAEESTLNQREREVPR